MTGRRRATEEERSEFLAAGWICDEDGWWVAGHASGMAWAIEGQRNG